ncbi:N-acetylmuramoyl-L-alanine amidase [Nonomuraea rubra]|uniref:N-acetylmuramoyl-L-alanine amidase n=1 Tax=Nonomuraea rubra TaxID=46180 RepID=UPI003622EEF8
MQLWLAVVLAAGVLTAPADVPPVTAPDVGRQAEFAAAAREYGVPESVLLAVGYLESRWDTNGGRPSTAGGYGPMHLVDAFPDDVRAHGEAIIGDALGDPRGDESRPMSATVTQALSRSALRESAAAPPRTTLPEAGRLIGVEPARLRTDPAANIRAGAALLASYQQRPSAEPADWHGAVARYAGTDDPVASRAFADEVFSVMREGAERRTDDGHLVRLAPVSDLPPAGGDPAPPAGTQPGATAPPAADARPKTTAPPADDAQPGTTTPPASPQPSPSASPADPQDEQAEQAEAGLDGWPDGEAGLLAGADADALWETTPKGQSSQAECPSSLTCEWMPAAYKRFGKKKNRDYGNHDHLARKRSVDYIVIHDTEGTYQGIPSLVRNPKYVSWHYTIRSRDGHVAQHVPTNDIAWHAGNWDVNTRSIGIEHEGYLAKGGAWYTEAMYRSSARLVKYLAAKHDIPLNRAHILGHDNVPGTTPQTVAGMHEDPGPYWDWEHYFELMDKPFKAAKDGDSVIIRPSYASHRPRFTGCVAAKPAQACPRTARPPSGCTSRRATPLPW